MTISKVPWRKSPRPEKGDVICTRLILPVAVPAVKEHTIQRGSVRTICLCKCPSRTAKGGEDLPCLQFRYIPLPHQAYNSYLLTKINDDCCSDTRTPAVIISNKKRMLPITGGILLINYLDLYLSISNRILNSCSCSSGVLAERNS